MFKIYNETLVDGKIRRHKKIAVYFIEYFLRNSVLLRIKIGEGGHPFLNDHFRSSIYFANSKHISGKIVSMAKIGREKLLMVCPGEPGRCLGALTLNIH